MQTTSNPGIDTLVDRMLQAEQRQQKHDRLLDDILGPDTSTIYTPLQLNPSQCAVVSEENGRGIILKPAGHDEILHPVPGSIIHNDDPLYHHNALSPQTNGIDQYNKQRSSRYTPSSDYSYGYTDDDDQDQSDDDDDDSNAKETINTTKNKSHSNNVTYSKNTPKRNHKGSQIQGGSITSTQSPSSFWGTLIGAVFEDSTAKAPVKMVRIRNSHVNSLLFATFAHLDRTKTGFVDKEVVYKHYTLLWYAARDYIKTQHDTSNGDPYDEILWGNQKEDFLNALVHIHDDELNCDTWRIMISDFLLQDDDFAVVLQYVLDNPQ